MCKISKVQKKPIMSASRAGTAQSQACEERIRPRVRLCSRKQEATTSISGGSSHILSLYIAINYFSIV